MALLPRALDERISFFEARTAVWADNAKGIGLTTEQADAITAATAAARAAYNAAIAARDAARAATLAQAQAVETMTALGSGLIKTVRAYAQVNDSPAVYPLASIPAPAVPASRGAPETPAAVSVGLTTAGHVSVRWSASRAGGTGFRIERRVQFAGRVPGSPFTAWTLIGTSEDKTYTDTALPVGLASAEYRVTAARSGGTSPPSSPVSLLLGTVEHPPGTAGWLAGVSAGGPGGRAGVSTGPPRVAA